LPVLLLFRVFQRYVVVNETRVGLR
jgi:hypothetical protein